MVIPPGEAEGNPENRHRGADQWLYVVAGTGSALMNGTRYPLCPSTLLLIIEFHLNWFTIGGHDVAPKTPYP